MKPQTRTFPHLLVAFLTILGLLTSACQFNVSRNVDGSLTVETSLSQQELQSEISAALSDPLIQNVTVVLQSGYLLINGERQRLNNSSQTDALSFRLDLGVSNGQLTAAVSNAQLDGKALEQNRVDNWNQTIANRLQKFGQRRPNTSLQAVTITTKAVNMTWVIANK
jgi:hypothetical protein